MPTSGALDLQFPDPSFDGLIHHSGVGLALAQWTRFAVASNFLDTSLAEVVPATAGESRVTEDGQTNGTHQIPRRTVNEVKLITVTALAIPLSNLPNRISLRMRNTLLSCPCHTLYHGTVRSMVLALGLGAPANVLPQRFDLGCGSYRQECHCETCT